MFAYFENDYSQLWVQEGILFFVYKAIPLLDLETAQKIVGDRLKYQQDIYFPILCDTRGIEASEKSARDYLAKEGSTLTKAVAILDDRNIARVMYPYYIQKNQPIIPTEVFIDREAALLFLESFV